MLYWLGVYILVIVAVAVPFLMLYLGVFVLWWCLTGIRRAIRTITNATLRTELPSHWGLHRRKPA